MSSLECGLVENKTYWVLGVALALLSVYTYLGYLGHSVVLCEVTDFGDFLRIFQV